jgi:hypothetical protein
LVEQHLRVSSIFLGFVKILSPILPSQFPLRFVTTLVIPTCVQYGKSSQCSDPSKAFIPSRPNSAEQAQRRSRSQL